MDRRPMTYHFHGFAFQTRTGELTREDEVKRLAPQPALALTILLEHAGRLVTREALQEAIWPDTVIEFDKGLNFCIREVRAALGDGAAAPTFIETLPRRGYRFIAPVTTATDRDAIDGGAGLAPARPHRILALTGRHGAVIVALLVLVVGGVWRAIEDRRPDFTPSAEARELGEMGGYLLTSGNLENAERSVGYFREAISLEPEYARAYLGLGSAYLEMGRYEDGRAALLRSIALAPGGWKPHLALGMDALYRTYDRSMAERHLREALERAPDAVQVQHVVAWHEAIDGNEDAAFRHMRRALSIDPVSPLVHGDVGRLFYLFDRHDQAVDQCRKTLELKVDALRPRDCLVHALVESGALGEARLEAVAAVREHGDEDAARLVAAGPPDEGLAAYWAWAARTITALAAENRDSHVHAAAAFARLGDADQAFEALERARAVHCPVLPQIGLDPAFRAIRNDDRFRVLLRTLGYPAVN